jgi:hypothetical protein
MKKMNFNEFNKRVNEVNKAFKIFSPLTNNMTDAFRLYQEVLAEERMEIFVSTAVMGNRPMTPIDDYERPLCPDCNSPMRFRVLQPNNEGVNTQLVCENCDLVLDSDKTIQEWYQLLEKKNDNGLPQDTEKTE